ncbi:tryptophan-rich sensory protein [Paenibacillus zeisoli]|uniref:Tryptophan-rich sensory protein n=1 Tax=Paenibacillus zeisoli TaxID=2496267 RepID=A0A3S1D5Z6_9BACL|nr:TspO/MBR family protein [Paenibacillus zeisoli]RUT31633.1 tryptophan-rich sensory protein [Paenibacillus zeisoli]
MYTRNPYKWWNILFYIGMIIINTLAVVLPLGGRSTGEISDMYPTPITPAGYAFSIWSVIYLLLAGFVIYQANRSHEARDSVQSIGIWFVISCILNMSWIILWQYLYIELSLIAMFALLISLIVIYRKTRAITFPTLGETWFVRLPFSIYLGWILVATLVNVAVVLSKNEWDGFGLSSPGRAIIMLAIGAVLAVLISYPARDGVLPLVFVWAYIAIALKQEDTRNVYMVAGLLALILFVYAVWLLFIRIRERD